MTGSLVADWVPNEWFPGEFDGLETWRRSNGGQVGVGRSQCPCLGKPNHQGNGGGVKMASLRVDETTGSVVLVVIGWLVGRGGWLLVVMNWSFVWIWMEILCKFWKASMICLHRFWWRKEEADFESCETNPPVIMPWKNKRHKPVPHSDFEDLLTTKPKPLVTGYGCGPKANLHEKNMRLKAKASNDPHTSPKKHLKT